MTLIKLILVSLVSLWAGFWGGFFVAKTTLKNQPKQEATTNPTLIDTVKKMLPRYWDKTNPYFVSSDNLLAFSYNDKLAVTQAKNYSNAIYIYPKLNQNLPVFNLLDGVSVVISKYSYQDSEVPFEKDAVLQGYNPLEFRLTKPSKQSEYDGVTFFNEQSQTYITKSRFPADILCGLSSKTRGYETIYLTYKTNDERRVAHELVNSIVTSCDYDLSFLAKPAPIARVGSDNLPTRKVFKQLGLSVVLPPGVSYSMTPNQDNKSFTLSINNNSLSLSTVGEYVGFSSSGALCANAGKDQCILVGKYLLPRLNTHVTVVKAQHLPNSVSYKAVLYTDDFSAAIGSSSITEVLKNLEILASVEVLAK